MDICYLNCYSLGHVRQWKDLLTSKLQIFHKFLEATIKLAFRIYFLIPVINAKADLWTCRRRFLGRTSAPLQLSVRATAGKAKAASGPTCPWLPTYLPPPGGHTHKHNLRHTKTPTHEDNHKQPTPDDNHKGTDTCRYYSAWHMRCLARNPSYVCNRISQCGKARFELWIFHQPTDRMKRAPVYICFWTECFWEWVCSQ